MNRLLSTNIYSNISVSAWAAPLADASNNINVPTKPTYTNNEGAAHHGYTSTATLCVR